MAYICVSKGSRDWWTADFMHPTSRAEPAGARSGRFPGNWRWRVPAMHVYILTIDSAFGDWPQEQIRLDDQQVILGASGVSPSVTSNLEFYFGDMYFD